MFARLLILFITVPLIELFLFAKIGSKIGLPATLVVIIITGALGAWLTKIQGLRTYAKSRGPRPKAASHTTRSSTA